MPIIISNEQPVKKKLEKENIFVMSQKRASTQDIRPLRIAILNLMPEKQNTELDLYRLLSNTPLQLEITLLRTKTHKSKNESDDSDGVVIELLQPTSSKNKVSSSIRLFSIN